jgi:DNA-binding NarL/FixJ family response regulator
LADDHSLVRSGIRSLLEAGGIEVVGEAGDGRAAVKLTLKLAPDVLFIDVAMAGLNGIEAVRQIRQTETATRILMLSMHADRQYIYESAAAGANGYVLKDAAFSDLVAAIEAVMAGRTYLSPGAAELAVEDYVRRAQGGVASSELEQLTAREREVLQLIAEGASSAEIGGLLHISARTVDTHRKNLMAKLGIHNIASLTRFAIRQGLCGVEEQPSRRR